MTTNLTWRERISAFFYGSVNVHKPPDPQTVVGSYNGMTLDIWKRSPDHIRWAIEQMTTPKFRDMLAVLSNAVPRIDESSLDPTKAAFELGRMAGMRLEFEILLHLAELPKPETEQLTADYDSRNIVDMWWKGGKT